MRALVLGVYGMLGHKLFLRAGTDFDTYGTCRSIRSKEAWSWLFPLSQLLAEVEADRIDSVRGIIRRLKPDVVINCIGIIKQLEASKDLSLSMTVNSLFPHKLALICKKEGARLVHFSTDCVFSGKKGNYALDDVPDAEDIYGQTKYLGEIAYDGCVTIRSSIIGRELGTRNGLVEWFLSQRGKTVKGYTKAIYTGFTTIEMSRIVSDILKKHKDLSGVWQVASKPISKYDLLKLIKEKMALDIEIEPDDSVAVDRSLDGSAFIRCTGYRPPSWESMIEELAEDSKLYETGFRRGEP